MLAGQQCIMQCRLLTSADFGKVKNSNIFYKSIILAIPFLVKSGFDFKKKNLKGETALDFALARKKQGSKAFYFLQKEIEVNESIAA